MTHLAEARQMLGVDPVRAAVLARQFLERSPHVVEARFILGAALRRNGDLHEALTVLAPLAEAQPGAWGLQYEHGITLAALGQCEAASAALMRATKANPRSSLAWHALGDQLLLLGRPVAATEAQSRPLPGSVGDPALATAAVALFDGRDGAAVEILRARFGIALNDVAALRLLADIGMRLGRPESVEPLLAAALRLAPGYLPARHHQAIVLHRLQAPPAPLAPVRPGVVAPAGVGPFLGPRGAVPQPHWPEGPNGR